MHEAVAYGRPAREAQIERLEAQRHGQTQCFSCDEDSSEELWGGKFPPARISPILKRMRSPACVPLTALMVEGQTEYQDFYLGWQVAKDVFFDLDSDSVADLSELLTHKDWRIVQAAAEALGRICDPSAVPSLIDLCRRSITWYSHEYSSIAAAESLDRLLRAHPEQFTSDALKQILELKDFFLNLLVLASRHGTLYPVD